MIDLLNGRERSNLFFKSVYFVLSVFGTGRTCTFGLYIGHKICHRVLATSATLLSRPAITMSEGLKIKKADVLPRSRSYLVQRL